ncbi:MAG: hypothetical protein ACREPU_07705 [Rhodanobacteraceae bacterium]
MLDFLDVRVIQRYRDPYPALGYFSSIFLQHAEDVTLQVRDGADGGCSGAPVFGHAANLVQGGEYAAVQDIGEEGCG